MKTILATGGLGFIGSHTCICLLENNFNVIIIDSLINSEKDNLSSIKKISDLSDKDTKGKINFLKGDIKNKQFLINTFNKASVVKSPIEAVLHFAGLKSVKESLKTQFHIGKLMYMERLILSVMKEYNCKKIVFSSSATYINQ